MKKIRYLSKERVQWLHNRILDLTGGERGDLSRSNLDFVLETVKNIGERQGIEKAMVKKASFLLYNLVTRHPFVNGNKRTAFEAMEAFLELNGYNVRAERGEIYALLADIAAGNVSLSQVEDWTATNLAKIKRD